MRLARLTGARCRALVSQAGQSDENPLRGIKQGRVTWLDVGSRRSHLAAGGWGKSGRPRKGGQEERAAGAKALNWQ